MISAAKNSNKLEEKSVEDMVTLGPTAQATLVRCDKNILHYNSSWVQLLMSTFQYIKVNPAISR